MIKIQSYAKSKSSGGSGVNSGVGRGFANNIVEKQLDTHLLWGNEFNGTQDVDGTITTSGGINAVDNITTQGDMAASTATFNTISSTNINNTDIITTSTLSATNTATTTLNADDADIKTLLSGTITTDYLTVTKSAHFWELIIDKITSSNGAVILSPSHAKVEEVITEGNKYTLFWKAEDKDTGKKISNDFSVGDQILCQTFNTATGTEYKKSNKYYWAVVDGKGTKTDILSNEITSFHYVSITKSVNTYDGDSVPSAGDEIVVLGNRQNAERQNAIILSATNGDYLDKGIKAPYIAQYKGIKTFELEPYRYNIIAANGNLFIGNFKVVNADGSIENIKNGEKGEKGDNATFNRLVAEYANLSVDEIGDVILKAKIYVAHTDGHVTTTLNDITPFGFDVSTILGGNTYTVTSGKNYFEIKQVLQSNYYDKAESERVEYCRIRLNENGVLTDTLLINNTVTHSSLFEVKNDAITAAVTQSNGYTDTKTAEIKVTTDNISLKLSTVNDLRNYIVGSAFRSFDVPYTLLNSKYPVAIKEDGVGGSKYCRISVEGATTTTSSGIMLNIKSIKRNITHVASVWIRTVKDVDDKISWCCKCKKFSATNILFNQTFTQEYGEWKLYTISFKTPLVFSSMWLEIGCKKNGVVDICRPMIEEGSEYNGYSLSQYDVNVEGKLKETGIDISNGQITLNATNTVVEGNLALYGTLRRKPTYINKTNVNKYVVYDGDNSWYFSDAFWQEGGCYVFFENGCFDGKGSGSIVGYLPSLGAETAGQTENNNMARSLVGAAITVYNNSGIDIAFSGRCFSSEKQGAGYGKLPVSFNSPPIANGRCGHFMCCMGAVNDVETIAWMYSTMKTVQ